MSILIKNVTVADAQSPYNGKSVSIFIEKGIIQAIGKQVSATAKKTIDGKNLVVFPGWVDILADYCDPGFEYKETIESGTKAAAAGGFTDVLLAPGTQPAISSKSILEYVQQKAKPLPVNIHVVGTITKNGEGKELGEMMDMQNSGAIAFSDAWNPVQNAQLMLKALEYVKKFNGVLIQVPVHKELSSEGLMHEGLNSLQLGMPGIPDIAETIMIQRDIELLRYTGSKLHISGISSAASLPLIKAAKKEGLQLTCSVTPYHLLFTDSSLASYNSTYKVSPPLRTEKDRKALTKAVLDGTIDCIACHHRPQDYDHKVVEFEYAASGMIGQETCFTMLQEAIPQCTSEQWSELLSIRSRQIFGLENMVIDKGNAARLTLWNKAKSSTYTPESQQSLGVNSPWYGKDLQGELSILV